MRLCPAFASRLARWVERIGVLLLLVTVAASPAAAAAIAFDAAQARTAVEVLADAASHGLDPSDYGLPALRQEVQRHAERRDADATQRIEQALAAAMQRFLQDLHGGRVPPREQRLQRSPFDAADALRAALAMQDVALAVRSAVPALPQYERLRDALARYRQLEAHAAWRVAWPARARPLEPGQTWEGVPMLGMRLVALGDLDAADAVRGNGYDAALVSAVQTFQQRHGLMPDGVIGRATWAALQVTPRQRVRQLELALERLRWTPLLAGPRMVVVNIPEFVLRAYEVRGERIDVKLTMKVIVGNALDTRTPLIHEPMRRIEFQPYWNVPASIARKELVPRLRREPAPSAYWEREGFEFVNAVGTADPVFNTVKLDAVLAGGLRIRQRPGPRNPLGDIKFVFPNRESIYLHHTPSLQLFERARRDFSHGCIRVEQPVALAGFVLQGLPGWTEERIRDAMQGDPPQTVTLAEPVPVLIAYGTALVKDGQVHFFDDIYGHDRMLDAALRRERPPIAAAWP